MDTFLRDFVNNDHLETSLFNFETFQLTLSNMEMVFL